MTKDRVIWLGCALLILVGFVLGANRDLFTNIKITDWLTSIGTLGAVFVALWTVNENHRQDTYKIKAGVRITLKKTGVQFADESGSFYDDKKTVVKLRVSNTGKRPITLESLLVNYGEGKSVRIPFTVIEVGKSDRYPILEPGAFFTKNFEYYDTDLSVDEAVNAKYLVVDANEKMHKAEVIVDRK